jgi:hypothetical protein
MPSHDVTSMVYPALTADGDPVPTNETAALDYFRRAAALG